MITKIPSIRFHNKEINGDQIQWLQWTVRLQYIGEGGRASNKEVEKINIGSFSRNLKEIITNETEEESRVRVHLKEVCLGAPG